MKIILIYSQEEAKRNKFVVDKICKNLGAKLVFPDKLENADIVINRTNDYTIAEYYESIGSIVFNNSQFCKLANNKQHCYDFMEKNNIPILPTRYKKVPFVKKPVDGHGGKNVVLCNDINEYDKTQVCQKVATDVGKDLRVWVIGKKIICSILRESKTDFRSNYCLGGTATVYNLSNDEIILINKIINLVNGDYYAIDFVFNNGKIIFNEIEDTVGARMIYDKTDIDIIDLFCIHIKNNINK